MSRFTARMTFAALMLSAMAAPAAAEKLETVTPLAVELATFRPTADGTAPVSPPTALEEAALHVPDPRPSAPVLAARAAMAPKLIARVSLSEQQMTVVVEGEVAHSWKVSTAGRGYRTPTGVWTPYRMHKMWYSRKYNNAPMPHSIFFTGGYAIHATPYIKKLGRPASHGCVRLHPDHAKELFRLTKLYGSENMRVVIDR